MFQTIASANATSPRPSCRRLGCAALRSSSCCVASAFPSSTRCVPTASASPRYLAIAAHGVDTRSCECVLHTSESLRWSLLLCVCVVCLPATLRLRLGCAANYAGYIKATVRLLIVLYILANIKITQLSCLPLDFWVGPVMIICDSLRNLAPDCTINSLIYHC